MFFSEEKNQKTFAPALADGSGLWPDSWVAAARGDTKIPFGASAQHGLSHPNGPAPAAPGIQLECQDKPSA
jgi:hypothetical protein